MPIRKYAAIIATRSSASRHIPDKDFLAPVFDNSILMHG